MTVLGRIYIPDISTAFLNGRARINTEPIGCPGHYFATPKYSGYTKSLDTTNTFTDLKLAGHPLRLRARATQFKRNTTIYASQNWPAYSHSAEGY